MEVKLLSKHWHSDFEKFLNKAEEEILISSPFINEQGTDFLLNTSKESCAVTVLTNLSCNNILKRTTDPKSLLRISKEFKKARISSLGSLHAKVYIIDDSEAIITSANLTNGGIFSNFEYGVLFNDVNVVRSIRDDLIKYFSLGNIFSTDFLNDIVIETEKLQLEEIQQKDNAEIVAFNKLLNSRIEEINETLLQNRIKEGRTVSGIFSETILYLLGKYDGMRTDEIHKHLKDIHPDICDDTIDRVISGQSFGKRWKHLVRGSQQHLKRQGKIVLENNIWKLNR